MANVKQHHTPEEVKEVVNRQVSRKIANVRFNSPKDLSAGRDVPFSTQAKAHFVGFCRLIRSYAVRLSCHFVATESLSHKKIPAKVWVDSRSRGLTPLCCNDTQLARGIFSSHNPNIKLNSGCCLAGR